MTRATARQSNPENTLRAAMVNDRSANCCRLGSARFADRLERETGRRDVDVVLTLGSGLASVAETIEIEHAVPFTELGVEQDLPAEGHPGHVLVGYWAGLRVLCFLGRMHLYEGYDWPWVTLPATLAHQLHARRGIWTNMSGGIAPDATPGTFLLIDRFLIWMRQPPLVGQPVQPAEVYRSERDELLRSAKLAAMELGLRARCGTYAAVSGPNYETPAEVRALGRLGADCVGMSTLPEVLVGQHLGLASLTISCVANAAAGLQQGPIEHGDVLAAARSTSHRLAQWINRILEIWAMEWAMPQSERP